MLAQPSSSSSSSSSSEEDEEPILPPPRRKRPRKATAEVSNITHSGYCNNTEYNFETSDSSEDMPLKKMARGPPIATAKVNFIPPPTLNLFSTHLPGKIESYRSGSEKFNTYFDFKGRSYTGEREGIAYLFTFSNLFCLISVYSSEGERR